MQLLTGILTKQPAVVLGSNLVGSCTAMGALAKNGPVLYCFSGGMHPDKGGFMYAYGADTTIYAQVGIRYARERGWKRIAIMSTTDASGKDGEHVTDLALAEPENKELTVVDREYFGPSDVSVTAQLAKIKAAGAQALILWGTGTPLGTVFNGMKQVGLDVPTEVSASNLIYSEMKQFAGILPRQLYGAGPPCAVAPESLPGGPLKTAVTQYDDAFRALGVRADISESVAYDPAWIVVGAYRKLGLDATAGQIRDYIAGLHDWYGSTGRYDFRGGSTKGIGVDSTLVVRWDADKDAFVGVSKLGGAPLGT